MSNESNGLSIWARAHFDPDGENNSFVAAGVGESSKADTDELYSHIQTIVYKCGFCGKEVCSPALTNHHFEHHSKAPFDMNWYHLFGVKNEVKCLSCGMEMAEESFKNHKRLLHSCQNFVVKQEQEPIIITVEMYKCKICGAKGILDENMEEHHFSQHRDVPMDKNIFKLKTKQFAQCFCGEEMTKKRLDEHMEQFHPEKLMSTKCENEEEKGVNQRLNAASESNATSTAANHEYNEPLQLIDQSDGFITLFKCKICHEDGISDEQLRSHHTKNHERILFSRHMYKSHKHKVIGHVCKALVKANRIEKHLKNVHSQKPAQTEGNASTNHSVMSSEKPKGTPTSPLKFDVCSESAISASVFIQRRMKLHMESQSKTKNVKKSRKNKRANMETFGDKIVDLIVTLYKCKICGDTGIEDYNLIDHLLDRHDDVPIDSYLSMFTFCGIRGSSKCDTCGRQMMKHLLEQHMKEMHSLDEE